MAKKQIDITKADDIDFDFNLSDKQYQAMVSQSTELFFGG